MNQINLDGNQTTLIHLIQNGRIVCMPHMKEFHKTLHHPHYKRTDAIEAVTCTACKKTAEPNKLVTQDPAKDFPENA